MIIKPSQCTTAKRKRKKNLVLSAIRVINNFLKRKNPHKWQEFWWCTPMKKMQPSQVKKLYSMYEEAGWQIKAMTYCKWEDPSKADKFDNGAYVITGFKAKE